MIYKIPIGKLSLMGRIIDFCLSIRKNFYEQKLSNVGINNGGFIHCEKNVCPLKKKQKTKNVEI